MTHSDVRFAGFRAGCQVFARAETPRWAACAEKASIVVERLEKHGKNEQDCRD